MAGRHRVDPGASGRCCAEHLKVARPSALGDGELTLAWAETAGLSKRKAEDAANRELIVRAIRAVTGAGLRLAHELRGRHRPRTTAPTLSDDELVERFVEEFEAEILPEPDRARRRPDAAPAQHAADAQAGPEDAGRR